MKRDTLPLVFGIGISTVLAGTLVIAGLKAGITPGVSPLVILVAWGLFASRARGKGGVRFLNITQVAGSAGMAVTAGVIFTAPVVQILYADRGLPVPPVDWATLILLSFAGAFIGFGFVGLTTRKFLSDPKLPAPEARACETMIEAAVADRDRRPRLGRSLFAGLVASFLSPLVAKIGLAKESLAIFSKESADGSRTFSLDVPFGPIFIGIGGLLTLSTALLVFGGSFLRLIGDGLLTGVPANSAATFPANSMRWVGGGAMTVAVAWSLLRFLRVKIPVGGDAADAELIEVDRDRKRWQLASVAVGMGILVFWLLTTKAGLGFILAMAGTVLVLGILMTALGAILSLQIGSSASPVSGTVFVTTLVLCLVALAFHHDQPEDVLILVPLLVAACVAVCTANDSSQDYKTLQLCGVRVQDGFKAQILGLVGGCIVVPLVLYVAHDAYTLGSPDLVAPQGKMFATLIEGLLLDSQLPWWPILIGLAVGALTVVMEIAGSRRGLQLPAMALAVGIYLPADLGIGILIGAAFRWAAERGSGRQSHESILAAAGLITGAAIFELLLGIAILGGFDEGALHLVTEGDTVNTVGSILAGAGIFLLGWLLYTNSRPAPK